MHIINRIENCSKTTTGIIAKAFNCEGNNNEIPSYKYAMNANPALTLQRQLFRCLEDAAQKGVDNIREIIDSVIYAPNETRFKIYIIDEVHMFLIKHLSLLKL